eukprot:352891-Chlamydomonas_euryale.AAC.12
MEATKHAGRLVVLGKFELPASFLKCLPRGLQVVQGPVQQRRSDLAATKCGHSGHSCRKDGAQLSHAEQATETGCSAQEHSQEGRQEGRQAGRQADLPECTNTKAQRMQTHMTGMRPTNVRKNGQEGLVTGVSTHIGRAAGRPFFSRVLRAVLALLDARRAGTLWVDLGRGQYMTLHTGQAEARASAVGHRQKGRATDDVTASTAPW